MTSSQSAIMTDVSASVSSTALDRLGQAERMLAEIATVEDALHLINVAEAARVWAEQMRLGTSAANHATAIKVKAELCLATLVDKGQAAGQVATGGRPATVRTPDSLADLGISRQRLSEARKLREAVPDATAVDAIVDQANEAGESVTRSGLLKMAAHYSSATAEWATPLDLFNHLDAEFAFTLDVCATAENAKCGTFYTEAEDGLAQPWTGSCWMNPPYGDVIPQWVAKAREAAEAGASVVALVPARVDTAWWWDNCIGYEIRFLRGRLKFGGGAHGAPFPSAVVVFSPGTLGLPVRWWSWKS